MRALRRAAAFCVAAVRARCFEREPKLSQDDEKLFEAVMYLLTGLEDNLDETDGKGMPWQRELKGRRVEYWHISKNGIGFSDDELNNKTRSSKYVRYVFRLTSPEPCTFTFEDIDQFSKGDSQEDFSVYSSSNIGNNLTFRFANAHTFALEDDVEVYVRMVGPRVACTGEAYCENAWNSLFSGLSLGRFHGRAHKDRREKALAVVKNACPGKEF
ncbi:MULTISPECIES: hypothetical protein [unclassified Bradyrhizobium]|uniref:hypothetical protein n=1 Tax=unclassified Bradyrhizobium TaxID=2631580 RepID=UPI0028EE9C87|nr:MULTISPECIES: hypothetical protein [unclassified Bradyrhizobium]